MLKSAFGKGDVRMIDVRFITFLTLGKMKSYTKTAEILNLTQPAVSQHIKFLEEYYGVSLVKKSGKYMDLTEEGKVLFKYAEKFARLDRALESEIRNKNSIKRTYNVGATMTIGGYVMPGILAGYKKKHDNVDIFLQVSNTVEITKKLLERKLDMALVEGPFDENRFMFTKFKEDELVLAVSPAHDFAQRDEVTIEEVLSGKLILREKGSGTRKIFENKLNSLGHAACDLKPHMEIGDISAIKSLVESNLGYTIISREAIRREMEFGFIKVIRIKGVKILRSFNFIYLPEGPMEFIEQFIGFCMEFKQALQDDRA